MATQSSKTTPPLTNTPQLSQLHLPPSTTPLNSQLHLPLPTSPQPPPPLLPITILPLTHHPPSAKCGNAANAISYVITIILIKQNAARNVGGYFSAKNKKHDDNEEKENKMGVTIGDRVWIVRGIGRNTK